MVNSEIDGPYQPRAGISRAKFARMLDDLRRLLHRWGGDLEEVIPFFGMQLASAEDQLARTKKLKGGAAKIWSWRTLNELWHAVNAESKVAHCTVEQACARLAKRGYNVYITDYSGPIVRDIDKTIRSSQALRAAFYKAEKEVNALPTEARRGLENDVQQYALRVSRGEVSVADISKHRTKVAKWHAKWSGHATRRRPLSDG